jgi:Asp-tRNA(Asn)/Glu-tRNA(Gln) amidotransferase A subunit family amidase
MIAAGRVSPVEVMSEVLEAIDRVQPRTHAFLATDPDLCLKRAREAERAVTSRAPLAPLHGVPVAVKDLEMTADYPSTSGTLAYRDYRPDSDSILVERLRIAGAIVVGKTNTPAFGLLGETKNRLGPPTGNPWDVTRTTGGSSGGSAAAVAAQVVPIATGTDSAGSINCPAGMCGTFGIKPSHGRIPMIPNAGDSLLFNDGGMLTRTVGDAALALSCLAGGDPRDPVSLRVPPPDFRAAVTDPNVSSLRVACSPDLGHFAVDPEVLDVVAEGFRNVEAFVASAVHDTPPIPDPWDVYTPLYVTDMRLSLTDFMRDHPDDIYPDTRIELDAVPPLSAEEYVAAYHRLLQFRGIMADFFERVDILLTPTTAVPAFLHDHPPQVIDGRPVTPGWMTFMPFQIVWNMTGQPAANVPVGFTANGLPVGMLVVGPVGREDLVLSVAAAYEAAHPWTLRSPRL